MAVKVLSMSKDRKKAQIAVDGKTMFVFLERDGKYHYRPRGITKKVIVPGIKEMEEGVPYWTYELFDHEVEVPVHLVFNL